MGGIQEGKGERTYHGPSFAFGVMGDGVPACSIVVCDQETGLWLFPLALLAVLLRRVGCEVVLCEVVCQCHRLSSETDHTSNCRGEQNGSTLHPVRSS